MFFILSKINNFLPASAQQLAIFRRFLRFLGNVLSSIVWTELSVFWDGEKLIHELS